MTKRWQTVTLDVIRTRQVTVLVRAGDGDVEAAARAAAEQIPVAMDEFATAYEIVSIADAAEEAA